MGVSVTIYEARQNVAVDVPSLCLMSVKAALPRGVNAAEHTNAASSGVSAPTLEPSGIESALEQPLDQHGRAGATPTTDARGHMNLNAPRAGEGLIQSV